MPSLMTVAACHLKDNNVLDSSVYKHSPAQILNSVCSGCCVFPSYFITTFCCFSKKQKLLLLMVYCTVCLPGCGSYKFLSIWLLTNTLRSRFLHNSILVFTFQQKNSTLCLEFEIP